MDEDEGKKTRPAGQARAAREARLAEALRANLRRRKAQARERDGRGTTGGAEAPRARDRRGGEPCG